jgi:hypothetical protein
VTQRGQGQPQSPQPSPRRIVPSPRAQVRKSTPSLQVLSCPVVSSRVLSSHVLSCPVVSSHVQSCPVVSSHVLSSRVLSCPVVSCHVQSYPVVSSHVLSCHVQSCPLVSSRVLSRLGQVVPRSRGRWHTVGAFVWTLERRTHCPLAGSVQALAGVSLPSVGHTLVAPGRTAGRTPGFPRGEDDDSRSRGHCAWPSLTAGDEAL